MNGTPKTTSNGGEGSKRERERERVGGVGRTWKEGYRWMDGWTEGWMEKQSPRASCDATLRKSNRLGT